MRKYLDLIVLSIVDVALLFVLMGADCESQRLEGLDEGFHVTETGLELQPGALPFAVAWADDAGPRVLEESALWWDEQLSSEVFFYDGNAPQVTAEFGYVPAPPDDAWTGDFDLEGFPLGIAYLDFDEFGAVTFCEIVVSSDIEYDGPTVAAVMRHEIGHCLGLADDPASVDLNSVMASPVRPAGELTPWDADRLQPYLP